MKDYFYAEESYSDLVSSAGTIIKEWDIGSWSGDEVYLLKKGNKFGFVVVGYGSCSVCDALQGCASQEDVDELKAEILRGIFWGTAEEVEAYAINEDYANRWYFHEHDWKTIKRELKAELRKG